LQLFVGGAVFYEVSQRFVPALKERGVSLQQVLARGLVYGYLWVVSSAFFDE
jgi:hypothetical protein